MRGVVLALLLAGLWLSAVAKAQEANPFGIVEGFWLPDETCALGVGWERIIFDWAQHQPTGPTDWHTLNVDDRWLKAANACGREVVALLKHTPAWATAGTPGPGVPLGLDLAVDDPNNHWANFVRQAAHYYASRGVHRFIIWNEPDITRDTYGFEFEGTLEQYAQLLRVAARAARQGNPTAQIHLAGTTYWHDVNAGRRLYLDRLLEHLTAAPDAAQHGHDFDVLSLHIYFRTDSVYDIVAEHRALLARYGLGDKAIWLNETNAPPTQDPAWPVDRPVYRYTLEQQAAFMVQAAALARAAGAERVAAYKLFDQQLPPGGESFGLLRPDQGPRPAYFAWQAVSTHLAGAVHARRSVHETATAVLLAYTDGSQGLVVWARTDVPVTLTVGGVLHGAQLYDGLGAPRPLARHNDSRTLLHLPGALCNGDDPALPCPVGGDVRLLRLGPGTVSLGVVGTSGTMPFHFDNEG